MSRQIHEVYACLLQSGFFYTSQNIFEETNGSTTHLVKQIKKETAFVEALNFLIRFPLLGSISQTIPSAPPLYMQEAFAEDETAFTPLHMKHIRLTS